MVKKGAIALIEKKGMEVICPDIKDLGSGIADMAAKDGACLVLVRVEARPEDGTPPPPFSLNRARVHEVAGLLESRGDLEAFRLSEVRLDVADPLIFDGKRTLLQYVHDALEMQGEPRLSGRTPDAGRKEGRRACEPER